MKLFAALNFERDGNTSFHGIHITRPHALQALQVATGKNLDFVEHNIDGPNGPEGTYPVEVDDESNSADGDLVGTIVCCEINPTLTWEWDSESDLLQSASKYFHDDESLLYYLVQKVNAADWNATFEGAVLHIGQLQDCLAACEMSEGKACVMHESGILTNETQR